MSNAMRPLVVGGETIAEYVRDSSDCAEWSIPSASSFARKEKFYRCVITADCDGIILEDRRVTSSNPAALLLEASSQILHLTPAEAEWLLARLPEALAKVKAVR
jgi:hypothetical protein